MEKSAYSRGESIVDINQGERRCSGEFRNQLGVKKMKAQVEKK